MDRFFQIKSLHQFNSKFRPRWVPRHIVYRQTSDLGPVFFAALSAEALLPFDRSRAKRDKADREHDAAVPAGVGAASSCPASPRHAGRRPLFALSFASSDLFARNA